MGATALVVVALVLGTDLAARPVAGESQREALVERPAVRHLTTSLARAVRELVGERVGGAAIAFQVICDTGPSPFQHALPTAAPDAPVGRVQLLPSLIDLPPPLSA
jgi:hypothetical protein